MEFHKVITESFTNTFEGSGATVDVENSVIRGVKLIGFESKNGRSYPASTLRASVPHYEGVSVNVDHPKKPTDSRSVRDRIGVIRGARFMENRGVFGDFHYNPKHPSAEQIAWDAANNPSALGFSHNANLTVSRKNGRTVVESIEGVRSADIVADPATTNGIFESENPDSTPEPESDEMSLKEMTLEQIYAERPDLKALVSKTSDGPTLESLQGKIDTLEAEKTALESEKKALAFQATVEGEISASGLTADQISEPFRKSLFSLESADDRAALIADRKTVLEASGNPEKKTGPKTSKGQDATESLDAASFLKGLRG